MNEEYLRIAKRHDAESNLCDEDIHVIEPTEIDGETITGVSRDEEEWFTFHLYNDSDEIVKTIDYNDFSKAEIPENELDCRQPGCDSTVYWWDMKCGRCSECQEKYAFTNVYQHNFGILVPMETGVIWQQQTNGVMCNHVQIEGIYIPMDEPTKYEDEQRRELLRELQNAHRGFARERIDALWDEIDEALPFEYERIDAPDGYPENQEGIQWIEITEVNTEYLWQPPGEKFIGQPVVLVHPNSD